MGISAFLVLPMAKENDKVELRLVEEDAELDMGYARLDKDTSEDPEDLPLVKLVVDRPLDPLDAGRDGLKTRSKEPDERMLNEVEISLPEEPWETQAVAEFRFPWVWVAVVACLFGIAILWSLINVKLGEKQRRDIARDALSIQEKDKKEKMDAESQIGVLEATVRDYFGSGSVEEMLRHVRHPERVAPLMEKHYAGKAPVPTRVVGMLSLVPVTIEKKATFWMASCDLEGSQRMQLALEVYPDKQVKVDWESSVCYQPMAWDEFATARPGGYTGDFRVFVKKDHFHSHEFADSEAHDCYRLTALDGEEALFGYVIRDSALAPRIAELVAGRNGLSLPVMLRLHLPNGLDSPRGVVIRELVCPRWLFVEDPGITEP